MAATYNSSLARWTTTSDTIDTEITLAAGDSIDLRNDDVFTFTQSHPKLENIWASNINRTVRLVNNSTTTPIFQRFGHTVGSLLTFQGIYEVQGDYIELGPSTGAASQTFTLPLDASGDKYESIACVLVGPDETSYLNVSSFANLYADRRGRAFTHDVANNTITFGDGTNGEIPPLGHVIKIYNIQLQFDYARINLFSGVLKWDKCFAHNFDLSNSGVIDFGKVGIYNLEQAFAFNDFVENRSQKIDLCGEPSSRVRLYIGNGTHGIFNVFTENGIDVSVIIDFRQKYTVSHLTLNCLASTNTIDSSLRLHLNKGSRIEEAYVFVGQEGAYRDYQGSEGSIGHLYYSTRAKRDHVGAYRAVWASGSYLGPAGVNTNIENITLYGTENQPVLTTFARLDGGENLQLRNLTDSATSQYNRFCEMQPASSCLLENLDIYGTAVDTNNVLNFSTNIGVICRNVKFFNETHVSLRPGRFMEIDNLWLIGNVPSGAYGLRSMTTRDTNLGDTGYIALQPFYQNNNEATRILAGTEDDYTLSDFTFYSKNTTFQVEVDSRLIGGVTAITGFSTVSSLPFETYFEVLFELRTLRGSFTGTFQTMNSANLISAFNALVDYDSNEGFYIRYRTRRIAGEKNFGINTLLINCNFDPTYEAVEELAPMSLQLNNIQVDDYIRIENASAVEQFYLQATSTTETISIPGFNNGENWKVVVDRAGASPSITEFTVQSGVTFPVFNTLIPYRRAAGQLMYTGLDPSDITIQFDLPNSMAYIRYGDREYSPQELFDKFERALLTSDGMAWHSLMQSIVQHQDLPGSGPIFLLGDNIRAIRNQASDVNSATGGYMISTQGTPIDGTNGNIAHIGGVGESGLTATEAANLLLAVKLMQCDQFFDKSTSLLHYYERGTTTDLIPPKTVSGEQIENDVTIG